MKEYCYLLNSLPKEVKTKIRKLEKTIKKKIKTEWSIKFNKTCLKEDILPNYSKFILFLTFFKLLSKT